MTDLLDWVAAKNNAGRAGDTPHASRHFKFRNCEFNNSVSRQTVEFSSKTSQYLGRDMQLWRLHPVTLGTLASDAETPAFCCYVVLCQTA